MDWWIDDSLPVGPKQSPSFPDKPGASGGIFSSGGTINFTSDVKILDYSQYVPQVSPGRSQIIYYSTGGVVQQ